MSNRIIHLYSTPPHKCNYLPGRQATTTFIDPYLLTDMKLYDVLAQQGFRRNGNQLYRPYCTSCRACVPVRVPVQQFLPQRHHRRIWKKNQAITVTPHPKVFNREHFNLYCRYLSSRHPKGGMDNPSPQGYIQFLACHWAQTVFYEFRLGTQLIAVAIVDHLKEGLSAVYTFFEPSLSSRSLGVYAILWEIEETKRLNKPWLYLGYWIEECRKMSYKIDYQPIEIYSQTHYHWQLFENSLYAQLTQPPPTPPC